MTKHRSMLLLTTLTLINTITTTLAFSTPPRPFLNPTNPTTSPKSDATKPNNILILDHLNINHEKGRHDLVKSFYFDFLQCIADPRKQDNLSKTKGTIWANIGSQQFHLPEGKPNAQVFKGIMTLVYPSLDGFKDRYETVVRQSSALQDTQFHMEEQTDDSSLLVTDPWGNRFRLISDPNRRYTDPRGSQPGDISEGIGMIDLTVYAPNGCNIPGIARFYDQILGASILSTSDTSCVISVGPNGQTLTCLESSDDNVVIAHEDLSETDEGLSNYGPHISMYISDLRSAYQRADELGVTYVNPRFKRRAYTLEEAVDDCMFRCLDIVDPEDVKSGSILKLEHEVRAVVKRDGSMYKSCPFDEIPSGCQA